MTKRLYYPREEQDTLSCTARVLECREDQDGYEICLDATVIFPEGGGQLSDQGQLCHIETGAVMAEVTHAREEGDLVFHRTDRPIQPGTQVLVKAREDLRRDHSAQHSGEHVLSGLAYTHFGAKNVGFHMAADYVTLDLDIFLDEEKLHALELAANQAVQRNLPTRVQVVDGADLAGMTLRKKAAGLTGPVRIVYVAGVDSCTCCGTHVAYAGEIGYIHLDSAAKYKGGTRLWFSCGMRGVERAWQEKTELDKLARRFSTKSEDVVEAVARQGDELSSCKRELKQRTGELLTYRAGELLAKGEAIGGVRLAAALLEGLDMGELKLLADKLCGEAGVVALLFSRKGDTLYYQLARSAGVEASMKELCLAVNGLAGGRGGGRPDMAQGSAALTNAVKGEDVLEQAAAYCRRWLGA